MNDRERLVELYERAKEKYAKLPIVNGSKVDFNYFLADYLIQNGVTVPVKCKDCKYHYWEQEPCHGKTELFCSVLKAQVFADFYCYHGQRKENGNE